MEEFETLPERVVKKKINEKFSRLMKMKSEDDGVWNSQDFLGLSFEGSSVGTATKEDSPHSNGKKRTRSRKSEAKEPQQSSERSCITQGSRSPKLKEHGEKSHRCEICGKGYRNRKTLDSHMLTHLRVSSYECNACWKTFDSKGKIRVHSCPVVDDGDPSQISFLIKGYSKKGNLFTHMDTVRCRKYPCTICGKQISRKENIRSHMRVHTGEKPYECYVCDKRFSSNRSLVFHMRTHTGEKPYHCTICEKRFVNKDKLERHLMVHTGEKPHHCTICGKNFSRKSYKVIHMRAHNSDGPKGIHNAGTSLFDDWFL